MTAAHCGGTYCTMYGAGLCICQCRNCRVPDTKPYRCATKGCNYSSDLLEEPCPEHSMTRCTQALEPCGCGVFWMEGTGAMCGPPQLSELRVDYCAVHRPVGP